MKKAAPHPASSDVWYGIDVLCDHPDGTPFRTRLSNKRVALVSHQAAVDFGMTPSYMRIDGLTRTIKGMELTALCGAQHGFAGAEQDNMIESPDTRHPSLNIPIFSLYGAVRRLRPEWYDYFDILLVDLQDVGVRVYTFLTTLGYLLEDLASRPEKELWILDRPNPLGRAIEGFRLEPGRESFVGIAPIPMQHGFTLGEFAQWYRHHKKLNTSLSIIPMRGWDPANPWPSSRAWIPPSPNMPSLATARCYPGTVMLEGTVLSEGRGTTRPLITIGNPLPYATWQRVYTILEESYPSLLNGIRLREVGFRPSHYRPDSKYPHTPCNGFELIAEGIHYDPAQARPFRLIAALLQILFRISTEKGAQFWIDPPYEYETVHLPIDVICGGGKLREWVESPHADWESLDEPLAADESAWRDESRPFYRYPSTDGTA